MDKPVFVNPMLNEEQIKQMKEYVRSKYNAKLYLTVCDDIPVYWRGMSRVEYKTFKRNMTLPDPETADDEAEEQLCRVIIEHPMLGVGAGMLNLSTAPAGLPNMISRQFMYKMGFGATVEPVEL